MAGGDRFVYAGIAGAIRKKIEDGEYPLGSRLPSERELAEEFYVNRMTIRRALAVLESEGMIKRRQGSGTYASSVPRKGDVCRLCGFTQTMREQAERPAAGFFHGECCLVRLCIPIWRCLHRAGESMRS